MPTNTTPDTATTIASLPFSATVNPDGGADSTFIPSCSAGHYRKPLWYVYTPPAGVTAIGITYRSTDNGADYNPYMSIWTGAPPAVSQLGNACFPNGDPTLQQFNVTPGVAHYFQITDNHDTPAGAELELSIEAAPCVPLAAGTLFVPNDTLNFPAAFLHPDSGALLRIAGFPACECGDILPNGVMAIAAEDVDFDVDSIRLYDQDLQLLATVTSIIQAPQNAVSPVRTNGSDLFYVASVQGDTPASRRTRINTLTDAGVVGGTSWDLPSNGDYLKAMAPSRDDTILYYAGTNVVNSAIHRYDLINDVALSDLVANAGGNTGIGRDMYVLPDDTILIVYITDFLSHTGTEVRRYSPAGVLLNTYVLGTSIGTSPRLALIADDPTSFWAMTFPLGTGVNGVNRFQRFDIASGVAAAPIDVLQKNAGVSYGRLYGPSQSCPVLSLVGDAAGCSAGSACVDGSIQQQPTNVTVHTGTSVTVAITLAPADTAPATSPSQSEAIVFDPNYAGGGVFTGRLYAGPVGDRTTPLTDVLTITTTTIVDLGPQTADSDFWIDFTLTCDFDGHVTALESDLATITVTNECECCMATKLGIINKALMYLGVTKILTQGNLDANDCLEAVVGNQLYDGALRETLRAHPWPFATKYADSADASTGDPMELVEGDGETAVNGDWMFAYRYPDDCLYARRILPAGAAGTGRQFNPNPVTFRVGRTTEFGGDDDYLLIFTNLADAVLEYTQYVQCREDFFDALFENTLTWNLASKLAPGLDRTKKTALDCYQMALATIDQAKAVAQREGQLEPEGPASWIDGR